MKGAEKIFSSGNIQLANVGRSVEFFRRGTGLGLRKQVFIWIFLLFAQIAVFGQTGKTWYNYSVDNSDNWDTWQRWTLDPDGSLLINPSGEVPGASDTVVILNGSTVNITQNNKQAAMLEIKSGGILNISGTTTGHNFGIIKGDGRIKLAADNYPAGDDTEFRNHGTVEYNGGGYFLNTSRAYYNLIINLTNAGDILTLKSNLTINNDFSVQKGIFRINDDAEIAKYTINVIKNVTVQVNGQITTGYGNPWGSSLFDYGDPSTLPASGNFHKIFHEFSIGGDLINFGNISFTNLNAPLYNNFASNGAVTVTFNGYGNNAVNLYGPVKFYNLIIDKGNNQTYVTTIYSANSNYFSLYGGNSLERNTAAPFSAANPEVRKALWIKNGTLKLTGNVTIPTLTESGLLETLGDYTIPSTGCLWIAGDNVTVNGTADAAGEVPGSTGIIGPLVDTYQGLAIFGKFRISQGKYYGRASSGIQVYSADETTIQIEGGLVDICQFRNDLFAPGGKVTYNQSGGTVNIRGDRTSAGEVLSTNALFEIGDPNSVFIMSGGTLNFYDQSSLLFWSATNDLYINSAIGNYNVTGGTVNVQVDGNIDFDINSTANLWNLNVRRLNASNIASVRLRKDLVISNDLFIDDNSEFDPNDFNVTIGRNLTIGTTSGTSNARFVPSANTTTFNGTGNSIITVSNSNTNNYFNPNNLVIDKTNATDKVILNYRPGTASTLIGQVRRDFTIMNGVFDYDKYNLSVLGNLDNNGVMGVWDTKGRILLNDQSKVQNINTGLGSDVKYGHIEINKNTTYDVNLINNNASFDRLTLTNGSIFINSYRLSIDTSLVESTAAFSATRMVKTSGEHEAKGLRFKMNGIYTAASNITFPIGEENGATDYYSPLVVDFNANSTISAGTLNVTGVKYRHPAADPNPPQETYNFYWKTELSNDFSASVNNVNYNFYNDFAHSSDKEVYRINGEWTVTNDNANVNATTPLNFATNFISGEFTAGKSGKFNGVKIYISNKPIGNWNTPADWTPNGTPTQFDFVIIQKGHSYTVAGVANAAELTIYNGGRLNIGNTTGHILRIVKGGGWFTTGTATLPTGDFDNFLLNDSAIFEYTGGSFVLPSSIIQYPNLKIGGTAGSVKTLPAANIMVRKDLMIYDDTNSGVVLALNNNVTAGYNLTIQDSLKFDNSGILRFPATGAARTVTVEKTIDFSTNNNMDANGIEIENANGTWTSFHSLIVKEDMKMNDNSSIILYRNKTDRRAVNLYFRGNNDSRISASASNIRLNYLAVEKDYPANIVSVYSNIDLTDDTDQALTLTRGALVLDHTNIDFYLTSGDGSFNIPESSQLTLTNGTLRVSGDGNGILLNSRLRLQNNSQLLMSNPGQNNFIEYSSTGNSELLIEDNAILTVGGQIRRKTATESGSLIYRQTGAGSVVTVGDQSSGNTSRGMFEILNPGSTFTYTGGALIIGRGQNTTDPALYLDPESYSLSDGVKIIFGNNNTPAGQNIGVYSSIPLKDIEVTDGGQSKSVIVYTLPLNIDSLRILGGQTFNANSNDINLNGNLHLYDGATYSPGINTTSFLGSGQKMIGDFTFYNLKISSADSVRIYNDNTHRVVINNNFTISPGSQISDRQNSILLKGNILNDGRHYSESMSVGGIIFQGTARQKIAGAGIYGIMIIDNSNGVELENNFTLVDRNVHLQKGSFYLREYQLAVGEKANITAEGGFSKDRMLVTNGAVSDLGIKKYVPAGTSSDIFFPIGVMGKYTPVTFTGLSITESGYIYIRPVNQAHPTVLDPNNVLQYHWNIQTSNFSSFNANINFTYIQPDVRVTAPNLETHYIPAYLNDISWAKFGSENIDAVNDIISYTFNTGTNIDGDFTAGINTAIPDQVPVFRTRKDGNWEDPATWEREDGLPVTAFPNGYVVRIRHNVTVTADLKSAYKTIIEQGGKIEVGTTIRHYFGVVSGRGHLSLGTGRLPAGNYRQFFACDGGTIEYGGTASYEIPNESLEYRRLIFSGSGTKLLPSNNITVCDTLWINGPVVDNSTHNNQITVKGLFELSSGSFIAGTGSNATVVFGGTTPQKIKGDFSTGSKLNNVTMNNTGGLTLEGNVTLTGKLSLINGVISTGTHELKLEVASTVTPVAGSASSFINGPLYKIMANGSDFTFPVGKGTRNGYVSLLSTNTGVERTWKAEYFNTGYSDLTTNPATFKVTGSEYWRINSAVDDDDAIVKLRWDAMSDINPLTTTNGISDIRVAEFNGTDWVEKTSAAIGNSTAGTVQTSSVIPVRVSSHPQYYTLGSVSTVKPTITLGSNPQVCPGSISASLPYLAISGSPVQYAVDYDATAQGQGFVDLVWTALPSSPINLVIPGAAAAGTYNATIQVRNATTGSIFYPFTVVILPVNTISAASSAPVVCINTPLSLTHTSTGATGIGTPSGLPSGVNATWSASTITISGTPDASGIFNYSIPLSGGCGNVSATGTITVNSLPVVTILFTETSGTTANDGTICNGDQVVITAGGGVSYSWSPASGLSAINIANPVAIPSATTTYTVTVTDNNSCINTADALVTVMPLPATGDLYRKPNN